MVRGPQYRPQNTIVLIIGTPKKVPLILGNPHIDSTRWVMELLQGHQEGIRTLFIGACVQVAV